MTPRVRVALRGELSLLAPEILVQMLALARASGCLVFKRGAQRCRLYLRDGRITLAHLGRRRSRAGAGASVQPNAVNVAAVRQRVCEALAVALSWHDGNFAFEAGGQPDHGAETVDADPQEILLACLSHVRTQGGGDEDGRE